MDVKMLAQLLWVWALQVGEVHWLDNVQGGGNKFFSMYQPHSWDLHTWVWMLGNKDHEVSEDQGMVLQVQALMASQAQQVLHNSTTNGLILEGVVAALQGLK
ncbi:hypothetical protein EDC04DRAFT_2606466 [Pisolithus marmoratus]|nr:hypothetical protein EDC04DRAFT_2606466 [Pisolithus marmoratus]